MAQQPLDRLDLIEQRLQSSRSSRRTNRDWSVLSARFLSWALCSTALVLLLGFPFRGYDFGAFVGLSVVVGCVVVLFARYVLSFRSINLITNRQRILLVLLLAVPLLVSSLCVEFGLGDEWRMLLVPAPLIALLLSVMYEQRFALTHIMAIFALMVLQSVLVSGDGVMSAQRAAALFVLFSGSLVMVMLAHNLRSRLRLLKIGLYAGLIMAAQMLAFELMHLWNDPEAFFSLNTLKWTGLALGHGLAAGMLATSLIPIVDLAFGTVTEIRLLELEDGNHPLLKMMLERAPGTYMHTQNVARIASTAVEAIGGNALLARVGTLFHDLGKMVRPEYFTENEPNSKLYHDRLSPQMSAIVIISHVKEGVQIARHYRLPRILEDFITGHHGTSLVKYFYHQAKMQATKGERVEESQYRYPGPKPQTKEAAIVAIADLVEAAGRAKLDGPQTPATLQKFVRDCVMMKLEDEQFDECDITLRELKLAEASMIKTLASMYHHRVKYPDDPDAKKRKLAMMEKEEYRRELAKRREKILTQ